MQLVRFYAIDNKSGMPMLWQGPGPVLSYSF